MLKVKLEHFQQARVNRGWSCVDLAKVSGVAASTICRLERGFSANPATAKRLADALDCPVTDLFELTSNVEAATGRC